MPYHQNILDRINDIVSIFNEMLVEEESSFGVEVSGFQIELSEVDGGKALGTVTQEWDEDEEDPNAWHLVWTSPEEIREIQRVKDVVNNHPVNPNATGTLVS